MTLIKVESSNIEGYEYNSMSQVLIVEFKNGGRYLYKGVEPHVVRMFAKSPSKGQFFEGHIKQAYRFEKLEVKK